MNVRDTGLTARSPERCEIRRPACTYPGQSPQGKSNDIEAAESSGPKARESPRVSYTKRHNNNIIGHRRNKGTPQSTPCCTAHSSGPVSNLVLLNPLISSADPFGKRLPTDAMGARQHPVTTGSTATARTTIDHFPPRSNSHDHFKIPFSHRTIGHCRRDNRDRNARSLGQGLGTGCRVLRHISGERCEHRAGCMLPAYGHHAVEQRACWLKHTPCPGRYHCHGSKSSGLLAVAAHRPCHQRRCDPIAGSASTVHRANQHRLWQRHHMLYPHSQRVHRHRNKLTEHRKFLMPLYAWAPYGCPRIFNNHHYLTNRNARTPSGQSFHRGTQLGTPLYGASFARDIFAIYLHHTRPHDNLPFNHERIRASTANARGSGAFAYVALLRAQRSIHFREYCFDHRQTRLATAKLAGECLAQIRRSTLPANQEHGDRESRMATVDQRSINTDLSPELFTFNSRGRTS